MTYLGAHSYSLSFVSLKSQKRSQSSDPMRVSRKGTANRTKHQINISFYVIGHPIRQEKGMFFVKKQDKTYHFWQIIWKFDKKDVFLHRF